MSYLFFAYWFTFHGQVVLWIQSRYVRGFARLNRRRAIVDSRRVARWRGSPWPCSPDPSYALFAVVDPAGRRQLHRHELHRHEPLHATADRRRNDPLENSMSVTTLPVIDRLHFNFSHHVEHHLFPNMSAQARAAGAGVAARANEADRYVSPRSLDGVRLPVPDAAGVPRRHHAGRSEPPRPRPPGRHPRPRPGAAVHAAPAGHDPVELRS